MIKNKKYISTHYLKTFIKYLSLFVLCYALLFLDINFYIVLGLIIGLNILFVKLETKYHLANQMARLIKEEKFDDALNLGLMKNAEYRDDFSRLLMLTAYYKTGNLDNAMHILKEMDRKRWKTKKVKKIVENWKVKMLLTSPYQLN